MMSDGRGKGGGSARSDFMSEGVLIKRLMRGEGGVKKQQKSSDLIYGRPLTSFMDGPLTHSTVDSFPDS